MTPAAEFNAYCDPEALAAVMTTGWPIRMVGVDVTRTVGIDATDIEILRASGKRTAGVIADLLSFYMTRQTERTGLTHAPMHDACALIPLLDPDAMVYRETRVDVELTGTFTRGMTVCDFRGSRIENPNVRVAVTPDRQRLIGVMMDTVLSYS
jgi:purine nucleosidase